MTERAFFTDPQKYFDVIMDETNEILQIRLMSEAAVMVKYRKKDDFVEAAPNTNVVIASMVTSYARIKLSSYINRIGASTYYFARPSGRGEMQY